MKKNNIGIITFHASLNCGSMLQAFALQNVLNEKYKQNVEIINYSNFGQRNYYANWDFFPKKSVLINNIKGLSCRNYIERQRADYNNFAKDNFNLSGNLIKKYSKLKKLDNKYDIVIAGGDQVWNVRCRDHDDAYFLSFVKNARKVAYSPSLGARNINTCCLNPKKYAKYLESFDFLSVREQNGQNWLKELTGKDIPMIADPTLLYTYDEWNKLIPTENINEKFIFYYAFSYGDRENIELLKKVSKKYNMPVYIIDGKSWAINRLENDQIKLWKQSGPVGFLTMMKNASIVLVQSFHGIVFSALFHKTFWSLRKGEFVHNGDDRAIVVLKQLGLEERAIKYSELLDTKLDEKFNFDECDKKAQLMRDRAFKYIEEFLK